MLNRDKDEKYNHEFEQGINSRQMGVLERNLRRESGRHRDRRTVAREATEPRARRSIRSGSGFTARSSAPNNNQGRIMIPDHEEISQVVRSVYTCKLWKQAKRKAAIPPPRPLPPHTARATSTPTYCS